MYQDRRSRFSFFITEIYHPNTKYTWKEIMITLAQIIIQIYHRWVNFIFTVLGFPWAACHRPGALRSFQKWAVSIFKSYFFVSCINFQGQPSPTPFFLLVPNIVLASVTLFIFDSWRNLCVDLIINCTTPV